MPALLAITSNPPLNPPAHHFFSISEKGKKMMGRVRKTPRLCAIPADASGIVGRIRRKACELLVLLLSTFVCFFNFCG
jgi:hypothetical protein